MIQPENNTTNSAVHFSPGVIGLLLIEDSAIQLESLKKYLCLREAPSQDEINIINQQLEKLTSDEINTLIQWYYSQQPLLKLNGLALSGGTRKLNAVHQRKITALQIKKYGHIRSYGLKKHYHKNPHPHAIAANGVQNMKP